MIWKYPFIQYVYPIWDFLYDRYNPIEEVNYEHIGFSILSTVN